MSSTIRLLDENNVANETEIMLWCNRLDILAIANAKGEVILQRLSWTRVWTLNASREGITVNAMSWRPDGKALAIAYSSGEVVLVSVENKTKLHSFHIDGKITCLLWTQEKKADVNSSPNHEQEQIDYLKNVDYSSIYLPDTKPFASYSSASTANEETRRYNILQNQTELNLLVVGTSNGFVHLNVFGTLPIASINLNEKLNEICCVNQLHFSNSLDVMYVTIQNAENVVKIVAFDSALLRSHTKELFAIASKHEQLKSLMDFLTSTFMTILETWENILLEMDTHLSKYAAKVPQGGIAADFLDLLIFGTYTSAIEEFLVYDLTKKGLEKFGQTIEMSYGSIQKLLLKYICKMGQNVTFHLAELRGLARLKHRYSILGLTEEHITKAIQSNGSFLIKAGEMQQIINTSMVNYKAFFRWLYISLMHLIDEPVRPEIPKMTQQDISSIAEFLQNFDRIGSAMGGGFIMEKLGQYLADAPLTTPRDLSRNEWDGFLRQNKCIANYEGMLENHANMSLLQQLNHLKQAVGEIFLEPKEAIKEHFKPLSAVTCFPVFGRIRSSDVTCKSRLMYFAFLCAAPPPSDLFCLLETSSKLGLKKVRAAYFYFTENHERHNIVDVNFYSEKLLTVLLQSSNNSTICQLPFTALAEKLFEVNAGKPLSDQDIPEINAWDFIAAHKSVGGMAAQITVSGSRKVSTILLSNKRKIKIYEMEAEEEDEDGLDATAGSVKDNDVSMQETGTDVLM